MQHKKPNRQKNAFLSDGCSEPEVSIFIVLDQWHFGRSEALWAVTQKPKD
jgi:hypothetical protein